MRPMDGQTSKHTSDASYLLRPVILVPFKISWHTVGQSQLILFVSHLTAVDIIVGKQLNN